MKRILDEDLRITLTQLDTEYEATEKYVEDRIEECYLLTQELDQELSKIDEKTQEIDIQVNTNSQFWSTYVLSCFVSVIKISNDWFFISYRTLKQRKSMLTFLEKTACYKIRLTRTYI